MANLERDSLKFLITGMALSVVNDLRPKTKLNFIQNCRIYREGELAARPVLDKFAFFNRANIQEVPHSLKLISNKVTDTRNYIAGVGTGLLSGNDNPLVLDPSDGVFRVRLSLKAVGFSGKPLAIVDFRPENSIQAFAYIADENKFVKLGVDDTLSDVGITAPSKAAIWKIGKPERKTIDAIEAGSEADWNHLTGSASAPTLETRVNTTVTAFVADGALPNFASIIPAAFTPDIQRGSILKLNGAAEVIVEDVLPSVLNTGIATISKISYDAGAAGLCTIVLSVSSSDIKRDTILKLTNATPTIEYVRVEEVTFDDNGIPSIRVRTTATFAVGNTVSGAASFRFYTTVSYVSPNTIIGKYIKSVITTDGLSSITRTFNVDFTNTGTKPLSLEDIFHISILPSDSSKIIEIQIQLNVGSTGVPFEENYFYYVINPNFLTGSADQSTPTISVIQQTLQRQQLLTKQQRNIFTHVERNADSGGYDSGFDSPADIYIPGSSVETALGQSQWKELEIPLKEFAALRVGSDLSRTLKDINAIRISVNSNDPVDISIDSIWIGGSNTLESRTQGFLPYNYVWRIRDGENRVFSNWSPPLRNGIKISRGQVVLSFPNAAANYPATYKIDIARFGGSLSDFRIVGSILNDGSEYTDISSDRLIADNDLAGRFSEQGANDAIFDFYKPFALLDKPKKGVCTIVGTQFTWISGDKLNITYPRGVQIVINGKANRFYTNPSDDSHVELEDDMGSLVSVKFEIEEPLLTGQALPIVIGTFGEGNLGLFLFGIGDKNAAGTLYWLDGNSPDTQSDKNRLEITSPSEPLITGVMYDGFPFIYTNKQSFLVSPTIDSAGNFSFIDRKNANSRGVYSRYSIAVTKKAIYHLTENLDGIVKVEGVGNPVHITEGIASLFYNNGKLPVKTVLVDGTEIFPPDYTLVSDLRFFGINDYLFFRFKDLQGKDRCLVFDEKADDWISYDVYINDKINAIYFEENESTAIVLAGIPDGIAKFETAGTYETNQLAKVVPFAFDANDSNLLKEFKEQILIAEPGTQTGFKYRNYYNNGPLGVDGFFDAAFKVITQTIASKRTKYIESLQDSAGIGVFARNITPVFEWQIISPVKLYEIISYFIPQGNEITDLSSDLEFSNGIGEKLWQGVVIEANTFGEDKELNYYNDRNELRATLIINHDGIETIAYSFDQSFISHSIRRTSDDSVNWLPIVEAYVYDPEPEAALVWEGEFSNADLKGLILIKRLGIAYRSEAVSTIKFTFEDGSEQEYTLPTSSEDFHKEFLYIASKKWKACKYRIESTLPIRVYKKHSEVELKSYNSSQGFITAKPFGGDSNIRDIQI